MVLLQAGMAIGFILFLVIGAIVAVIAVGTAVVIYNSIITRKYKDTAPTSADKAKYMFISGGITIVLLALLVVLFLNR